MSIILTTQEAEIRRITVQNQHRVILGQTLSQKTHHKTGLVGWLQGIAPEFIPQYCKNSRAMK
jgi:hypothetical protein